MLQTGNIRPRIFVGFFCSFKVVIQFFKEILQEVKQLDSLRNIQLFT